MGKKIFTIILCIVLLSVNLTFGAEVENQVEEPILEAGQSIPITIDELGTPKNLTAEFKEDDFFISWTNPAIPNIKAPYDKIEVQVDYREGKAEWLSEKPNISYYDLPTYEFGLNPKPIINFDPIAHKISTERINLDKNSYNIRLRYVYIYLDERNEKRIYGNFSSDVNLGLQPYYHGASSWAIAELDKAVVYGMVTESIRPNMKANINREEFSEVIVKLYEKAKNKPISTSENPFVDTENADVIKAASLGIVVGVGDGKFVPKSLITRQEMAVMLSRTLELIYPSLDYKTAGSKVFPDGGNVSQWAIKGVQLLTKYEIIKGDEVGNLNPLSNTTREQAVAIVVRAYEMFK